MAGSKWRHTAASAMQCAAWQHAHTLNDRAKYINCRLSGDKQALNYHVAAASCVGIELGTVGVPLHEIKFPLNQSAGRDLQVVINRRITRKYERSS